MELYNFKYLYNASTHFLRKEKIELLFISPKAWQGAMSANERKLVWHENAQNL